MNYEAERRLGIERKYGIVDDQGRLVCSSGDPHRKQKHWDSVTIPDGINIKIEDGFVISERTGDSWDLKDLQREKILKCPIPKDKKAYVIKGQGKNKDMLVWEDK